MKRLLLIMARSLSQHRLSSWITVLTTALASGLVMAVFALAAQTQAAFAGGALGIDAVVGARGSALQLVLNAVFHLETSPGNLPWRVYQRLADDPRVATAVPLASGDSWRGFRVVGTGEALFDGYEQRPGEPLELAAGRPFDGRRREAVLGAAVAAATGLGYGDSFRPTHGLRSDLDDHDAHEDDDHDDDDHGDDDHGEAHDDEPRRAQLGVAHVHEEDFVVVGVLAPTFSPTDRVVWIPIDAVWRMEGHVLRGGGENYTPYPGVPIPDRHKEVSAVLLKLSGPMAGFSLGEELNRQGREATLAWPLAQTLAELFRKLGWMGSVLELVAAVVLLVAAGTILASLTTALHQRRREFAILRALGARRRTLSAAIVLEATTLAAVGSLGGLLVAGLLVHAAASVVRTRTGVVLDPWTLHPVQLWTPVAMTALGALAGALPARRAYATDVAENLVPPS